MLAMIKGKQCDASDRVTVSRSFQEPEIHSANGTITFFALSPLTGWSHLAPILKYSASERAKGTVDTLQRQE